MRLHQAISQKLPPETESDQEIKLPFNFDKIVENVLKEHQRIYNYKLGWRLLLDVDSETETVLIETETDDDYFKPKDKNDLFKISIKQKIYLYRLYFIAMLQIEFPELHKTELLDILGIKNIDKFI